MTDYSKLSDEELDQRLAAAEKTAPPGQGYAHLSDAELDTRLAEAERAKLNPSTVQEMHPDFTAADRLVVKNFSTNNEAAVNYLQKRHPNLEIAVDDQSGQIKARGRDGKDGGTYRVLDPDTGFFSSDILNDTGDIAFDALSGAGTGLATGAAGVAGAAAGGIGAVPAAMAGGAAAGAGFEGLKQALGKAVGLEDNFSGTDIALGGAAGAISPLLLGTGATAGQVAKGALKQGLTTEAELAALQASQRGLVGRGVDKFVKPGLTKAGAMLSGVSEDKLKGLAQNYDEFARIEATPGGSRQFAKETAQELGGVLRTAKKQYGDLYQAGVDSLPPDTMVPLASAREALELAATQADETALASGSKASRELADNLKKHLHDNFYKEQAVLGEAGEAVFDEAGKAVTQLVPNDALPLKAALELEKDLSKLAQFDKLGAGNVKGGVGHRLAGQDRSDMILSTAAANGKKELEKVFGEILPPEAMAAKQKLGGVLNMETEASSLLGKKPKKIMKTLRNITKPSNTEDLELLVQLDNDFGTDMVQRANMAGVLGTFRKPGALPLSEGGVSGLARAGIAAGAGGALGAYLGRQTGSAGAGYEGGLAGMAAGGLLGGPAMMRNYIRAGLKGGQVNQFLGPARVGIGSQALEENSPWTRMK